MHIQHRESGTARSGGYRPCERQGVLDRMGVAACPLAKRGGLHLLKPGGLQVRRAVRAVNLSGTLS